MARVLNSAGQTEYVSFQKTRAHVSFPYPNRGVEHLHTTFMNPARRILVGKSGLCI